MTINLKDKSEDIQIIFSRAYEDCERDIKRGTDRNVAIKNVCSEYARKLNDIEKIELQDYIEQEVNALFSYEKSIEILDDKVIESTWWTDEKHSFTHRSYWNRYNEYLKKKGWNDSTISNNIDAPTDNLMNLLINPNHKCDASRKGLVFGHVQSGKTAHYIGLINKAVDAGYKIIVVLAGIHNNLRSQTQVRIDEEVIGIDTRTSHSVENGKETGPIIGVGLVEQDVCCDLSSITRGDENGDIKKTTPKFNSLPLICIVKKTVPVLTTLIDYWKSLRWISYDENNNPYFSADYPLLLIDDEADQASINTVSCNDKNGEPREDYDPSRTNALIRDFLQMFRAKTYVGYTATPYASIFIPTQLPKSEIEKHGPDLFPDDFIVTIPRSKDYVGAREFFGWRDSFIDSDYRKNAMPLYREIKEDVAIKDGDSEDVDKYDRTELRKALMSFLLSTACRNCRGQRGKPNTMLIHIERYINEQDKIEGTVLKLWKDICSPIKYNTSNSIAELKKLWDEDYVATTEKMRVRYPNHMGGIPDLTWDEILKEIRRLTEDVSSSYTGKADSNHVKIYSINGKSEDALRYSKSNNVEYNVIAIGGDKLARGLTLEGLTVSYFLRNSRNYDTLMQMGRWFGYRTGYLDLCRLYASDEIYSAFLDISIATDNLVSQFETVALDKGTPREVGFRVEQAPGLIISSKIKNGELRKLSFASRLVQTRLIDVDSTKYKNNFNAVDRLLKSLGKGIAAKDYWKRNNTEYFSKHKRIKHYFWTDVPGTAILSFLEEYKTSKEANSVRSEVLRDYIKAQMDAENGLSNWTICLINRNDDNINSISIGNVTIGKGISKNIIEGEEPAHAVNGVFDMGAIVSEDDELLDFTLDQWKRYLALKETYDIHHPEGYDDRKGFKAWVRKTLRVREHGFMLIYPIDYRTIPGLQECKGEIVTPMGLAFVFPDNQGKGQLPNYRVNPIGLIKGD